MNIKNKIILIGGGGHCRSVINVLNRLQIPIEGISDIKSKIGQKVSNIPVICDDSTLKQFAKNNNKALITVGSVKTNDIRKNIYNNVTNLNFEFYTLISKSAIIGERTAIGFGTVIMENAFINCDSNIGVNTIINTSAIIEHDTQVGDHVHIAPGAVVSGGVKIGEGSFIGAGAVIRQGITIGENCIVGAGSVVVKDVMSNQTIIGHSHVR